MTPSEWNAVLAPDQDWKPAYAAVEQQVKLLFAHNPLYAQDTLSTAALVEALYPETYARGEGQVARRRMFKALQALAPRGLSAYATKGPAKMNKMRVSVRPWLWRAPAPVEVIPDAREAALRRIATEDLDAMQMQSIASDALMGVANGETLRT